MASTEFRRKALFFIIFAGIIVIILMTVPLIEGWLRTDLLRPFGFQFIEGRWSLDVTKDYSPTMMQQTAASLFDNFFHVLKIILWMSLVISTIRFISYLIFGTAFKKPGQPEISS